MTNKATVFYGNDLAGTLIRTDTGYEFGYDKEYLQRNAPKPISLTLPLSDQIYKSNILFPFFDGLIPEGWLLNLAREHWNLKSTDRFELLATLCRDTIGAVTVIGEEDKNE